MGGTWKKKNKERGEKRRSNTSTQRIRSASPPKKNTHDANACSLITLTAHTQKKNPFLESCKKILSHHHGRVYVTHYYYRQRDRA